MNICKLTEAITAYNLDFLPPLTSAALENTKP